MSKEEGKKLNLGKAKPGNPKGAGLQDVAELRNAEVAWSDGH